MAPPLVSCDLGLHSSAEIGGSRSARAREFYFAGKAAMTFCEHGGRERPEYLRAQFRMLDQHWLRQIQ